MSRRLTLVCLSLVLAAAPAAAQLADLYVRGFVSQGYLNSSHNNYLVPNSRDGSSEFHEAAVSLQAHPEERLRVGLQFLARDFGDVGNNDVLIDWAYADYQWQDYMGVRLGKFKTTQGLYGQGRDVDMLRPTVLLPQAVYNEDHRDFILGVEGLGFYGNVPLGEGGGLDYEIYGGTLNVPDPDAGFWYNILAQAGEEAARLSPLDSPTARIRFDGVAENDVHFDWLYGGSLRWNTPLEGLTLGVSGITGRFDMHSRLVYSVEDPAANPSYYAINNLVDFQGDLGRSVVFSAEWSRDDVTLAAELAQEEVNGLVGEGYYLQASAHASERTTVTAYYSRYVRDKSDPSGHNFERYGYPDYVAWQNDVCAAVRHDATEHLVLKGEYHVVDGLGLLSPALNDLGDPDAYKRWWSFMAFKATVHF
ncbi:hypothetical protein KDK88_01620 [bacterium]|nr:hypothetical protein [bacterium]HPF34246.1 hypothetical protein [Candidatus Krumholzibacteria bacterium]HRX49975.1 hypothetical protein [Candidatus Krumholzibacteria bacterium]